MPRISARPSQAESRTANCSRSRRGLRGCNLVGAEVVEAAPAYGHAELTGLSAANVVDEFLLLLALGAGAAPGGPAYGESKTVYGA